MRYTYTVSALRDKRARIAGEIEAAERKIAKDWETLASLDGTLRLFHPEADPNHIMSIRPKWRGVYFRNGERTRLCLEALRDAGGPVKQSGIAEYVMLAKGMDLADKSLRALIANIIGMALFRLAHQGKVRKILDAPDIWWELTGR